MAIDNAPQNRSWVDQIITSNAFDDYEGGALENLRKYGDESGFCVQYMREGEPNFYDFARGDNGSVAVAVPRGGDRLLHIHYHPSSYVSPSTEDIHGADIDAAILRKELEVPPVHMIGALVDDAPLYLARQRKGFPGYVERTLLTRVKPDNWHPSARKMYKMESNMLLFNEIKNRIGEEKEKEMRGRPVEEVLDLSGISYTDIAKMKARALQKSYGYKTGVIGSADLSPESQPISESRAWLYGNGELFD